MKVLLTIDYRTYVITTSERSLVAIQSALSSAIKVSDERYQSGVIRAEADAAPRVTIEILSPTFRLSGSTKKGHEA